MDHTAGELTSLNGSHLVVEDGYLPLHQTLSTQAVTSQMLQDQ